MMRMHAFRHDQHGSFASAALPLVFATLGMTLLGVGAVLSIMPMAFAGIGLAVVGFAAYLIASGMDRQDRRRAPQRDRAEEARIAFGQDMREAEPLRRSPLADEAVAALTGEARGGIWPPIGSHGTQGAPRAAEARQHEEPLLRPMAPPAQGVWAPGGKVGPAGWDDEEEDEVVEFSPVARNAARETHSAGGVTFVEGTFDPHDEDLPQARPRVQPARPDPTPKEHDFRVWPGAKDIDSWTTFTGERKPQTSRFSDEEIKAAMTDRRRQMAGRLPMVGAILSDVSLKESEVERLKREATRGKCSQCAAIIWAPKKRPIVLKCPGCGHKAKLY